MRALTLLFGFRVDLAFVARVVRAALRIDVRLKNDFLAVGRNQNASPLPSKDG